MKLLVFLFRRKYICIYIISLLLAGYGGMILQKTLHSHKQFQEIRDTRYTFISPLLECEYGTSEEALTGLNLLQREISDYITENKNKKEIDNASVYLRDLNNGPWLGVNEHDIFSPASLLKLPVLMAYYKQAEKNPTILTQRVKYEQKLNTPLQKFSFPTLQVNDTYTIDELLQHMIIYSDNEALAILEKIIDENTINQIHKDLGVELSSSTSTHGSDDFITVKGYAGLFRILYNATYLEKDSSEKALKILSQVKFKNGIVAGVPTEIKVSHKYGERALSTGEQLHDCGIVYYPNHPYLLCVMTKGEDYQVLARNIREISKRIYTYLDNKYKGK